MTTALAGGSLADDYSAWSDSTRLFLNTTPSGADVSADVADFPVLVRLGAADIAFSEMKADGSDLRFADSAGAALPFQLDRFDAANKLAEAWVLLPSVKGNSSTQWFKMHWGNLSATLVSSGAATFPADKGFAAVWHLGEDGGTAAGAYKDAGANGNHGTGQALTASSDVAGAVALGTHFSSGLSQGISVPHHASLHPDAGLTVEAWIKSATQGPYKRFVGKPYSAVAAPWNEYSLEADSVGTKAVFSLSLGGLEAGVAGTTAMANGAWYHVAGTWDGSSQKVYVNGVLEGSLTRTGTIDDYGQALAIGKYALDAFSNFDGAVDEARVARTARTADWIKLTHASQKPGAALVSFKRFEGCVSRFAVPPDTSVEEGALIDLEAQVECATSYGWEQTAGPSVRINDPQSRSLRLVMPRVSRDTLLAFRFSAEIGGLSRAGEVKVVVREGIPDPEFTFAVPSPWSGSGPLELKPVITNAAAVAASRAPDIRHAWTVTGVPVDTALGAGTLILSRPAGPGDIVVRVCLDNGGMTACREGTVVVSGTTGPTRLPDYKTVLGGPGRMPGFRDAEGAARDARGRLRE
jgi:hypothetical protein